MNGGQMGLGGIVQPSPAFDLDLQKWIEKNSVGDYGHPQSFYDYYGAYKAGISIGKKHHWPDTFKLPGHPTFSVESIYYRPGMQAGYWEGDKYIPLKTGQLAPSKPSLKY